MLTKKKVRDTGSVCAYNKIFHLHPKFAFFAEELVNISLKKAEEYFLSTSYMDSVILGWKKTTSVATYHRSGPANPDKETQPCGQINFLSKVWGPKPVPMLGMKKLVWAYINSDQIIYVRHDSSAKTFHFCFHQNITFTHLTKILGPVEMLQFFSFYSVGSLKGSKSSSKMQTRGVGRKIWVSTWLLTEVKVK